MTDFAQMRRMMVDNQLRTYDVTSQSVLAAMAEVPRELFVPAAERALAYSDRCIPLQEAGELHGRELMTPMSFARLVQAARIEPGDRVLVVAAGTGYGAAVAARLGGVVVALEGDHSLRSRAEAILRDIAAGDVRVVGGDNAGGHRAGAPYDVIIVEGAFEVEPSELVDQLADGGRLVGIRGAGQAAAAVVLRRSGEEVGEAFIANAAAPVLSEFRRRPSFAF
jgi:protein-L-isoaspartate(D-aspartate) O-methyltransferase